VATGGPGVVKAVLSSGKKAIGAGAGNPPVLVDETACIRKAAEDIINGHCINNNIFCISEKEVIAVDEVADNLLKFMEETGKAAVLTPEEARQVTATVIHDNHVVKDYVGKDVGVILKGAGITRLAGNENLRCVVFEADRNHPLVWIEQLMPVLPLVRVKDVWEGIDLAVEVEQGNRHTAMMHSTNVEHLTALARAIQTTIFVKNGPSYCGIGLNGEGHATFTIAGPTGEGITSARSFCRQRRCVLIDSFRIV
jgi:propionaldehyde dehydrogenase